MPASNDRGINIADLCDQLRNQSVLTRKCRCGFQLTGTFEETRAPFAAHIRACVGRIPARRVRGRSGFVTETNLEENIQRARLEGSWAHTEWDDAA